jgi:hypothetical protein
MNSSTLLLATIKECEEPGIFLLDHKMHHYNYKIATQLPSQKDIVRVYIHR